MISRYEKFTDTMFGSCVVIAIIDGINGDWSRLAGLVVGSVLVAVYICIRWRSDGESRFVVNPKELS